VKLGAFSADHLLPGMVPSQNVAEPPITTRRNNRIAAATLFLVLLAPSAWFAWTNRDMPSLGRKHDDAVYYLGSKSLTMGQGYRILSLPGQPFETKYPPVLSWLLTLPWLMGGFPQNLVIATAIQWAAIPLFLWLSLLWLRRLSLPVPQQWIAIALLALSPYTVTFGAGIFPEVLFTVFLLASLLLCDESRRHDNELIWAAAAGALAGVAYLTRTAGVVALVSGPLTYLLWRRWRSALAFTLGMLPAVLAWMIWVKLHHPIATDPVSLFYTDYVGFQFLNVKLADFGLVTWTNVSYLLDGIGSLVFPIESDSIFLQFARKTVAVAAIAGLVRRRHNPLVVPYALFAVLMCLEQIVWHFPPNLRMLYPLVPLLAAGLTIESEHFIDLLRRSFAHPDSGQRGAAWVMSAGAVAVVAASVWMQCSMTFLELPRLADDNRRWQQDNLAAYNWIAANTSVDSRVVTWSPGLYLYTGRQTVPLLTMPIQWYRQDTQQLLAPFRTLSTYASVNGLSYVYFHRSDYGSLAPGHGDEANAYVERDPGLQRVFRSGQGTVYRVVHP
jgi:4-amino-4-deoxy-L-arabinose transferase-like glycosyltransferase